MANRGGREGRPYESVLVAVLGAVVAPLFRARRRDGLTVPRVAAEGIEVGRGELVDSPIWLSGVQKRAARRAPKLGEHTDEVLTELGYDAAAIGRMRAERAVE